MDDHIHCGIEWNGNSGLNKGTFSLGGSFGYSASGTPQVTPLATNVETMTVTNNGPVWH